MINVKPPVTSNYEFTIAVISLVNARIILPFLNKIIKLNLLKLNCGRVRALFMQHLTRICVLCLVFKETNNNKDKSDGNTIKMK